MHDGTEVSEINEPVEAQNKESLRDRCYFKVSLRPLQTVDLFNKLQQKRQELKLVPPEASEGSDVNLGQPPLLSHSTLI